MSEKKKTSLYGRNITSEMRQLLSWRAVYLLDLFEGLWRSRQPVRISNQRIAEEFQWSTGSVKRALAQLKDQGFIRVENPGFHGRRILPGGGITIDPVAEKGATADPPQDQERSSTGSAEIQKGITDDPYKTLEIKTPEIKTPESDLAQNTPGELLSEIESAPPSEYLALAEASLIEAQTPEGKRRMINYPHIWISKFDLIEVLEKWDRRGLESSDWAEILAKVEKYVSGKKKEGLNPKNYDSYSALKGWACSAVMSELTTEVRLQREKLNLAAAKARRAG